MKKTDQTTINQRRLMQALQELDKHQFGDLTVTKHRGVIRGYRINAEVRFMDTEEENHG